MDKNTDPFSFSNLIRAIDLFLVDSQQRMKMQMIRLVFTLMFGMTLFITALLGLYFATRSFQHWIAEYPTFGLWGALGFLLLAGLATSGLYIGSLAFRRTSPPKDAAPTLSFVLHQVEKFFKLNTEPKPEAQPKV